MQKRKENIRELKASPYTPQKHILFSFRYLNEHQIPPGQTLKDWEEKKILSSTITVLHEICKRPLSGAFSEGFIKLYDGFPENSEFKLPDGLLADAKWGVIKNLGNQKMRIAGFLEDNIFYIIFLDKEHKFYPSKKKHT